MVIKDKIMNLSKKSKLIIIFVFMFLAIFVSVGLPTIARIRNRVTLADVIPWNGEVATSYNSGEGTKSDPYIITNGNELAFFSEKLKTEDKLDYTLKSLGSLKEDELRAREQLEEIKGILRGKLFSESVSPLTPIRKLFKTPTP